MKILKSWFSLENSKIMIPHEMSKIMILHEISKIMILHENSKIIIPHEYFFKIILQGIMSPQYFYLQM